MKYFRNSPRLRDRVRGYIHLGWEDRHWYSDAHTEITNRCKARGWDSSRYICILALTSPRVSVKRNVKFTEQYIAEGTFASDVMVHIRKSVVHYEYTSEIRGLKTSAFSRALLGDETALVLDVWMAYAFGVDKETVTRRYNSARIHRVVYNLAEEYNLTVAQCQAAIWAGIRANRGHSPATVGQYL